ncbi:hypothetical protein QBC44DRAFT_365772 [Cladorrhinum sp. PSN332]|nr:hypothetical protein QBC44DRAFT_365772 [Cladorrhinum sp. PSN332]
MCKGHFIALICPKGWRDGWNCPWYHQKPDGIPYCQPYSMFFQETDFECCGCHAGECEGCLSLYTTPNSIRLSLKEYVECEQCQGIIDQQRANGEYVLPTVEESVVILPEAIRHKLTQILAITMENKAVEQAQLLARRRQEVQDNDLTRSLFEELEAELAQTWIPLPDPRAGIVPGFGDNVPQNLNYEQQPLDQLREQGFVSQNSINQQQQRQQQPALSYEPVVPVAPGQSVYDSVQQPQPTFQSQLFNQQGGEFMYPQQTYGFQDDEQDALDYFRTANGEQK